MARPKKEKKKRKKGSFIKSTELAKMDQIDNRKRLIIKVIKIKVVVPEQSRSGGRWKRVSLSAALKASSNRTL